jgi:hypothetical protein
VLGESNLKIKRLLISLPVIAALVGGGHAPPRYEEPAERPPIAEFQRGEPENRLVLSRTLSLREEEARRSPFREEPHTPHKKFEMNFPKAVLKGHKIKFER